MNGMGLPVEHRVIHDGQVLTDEEYVARRLHPGNHGRVLTGIRVECDTDLRPVGHDGFTFSPPAVARGNGEHPGGSPAAPSGVSPHHQQACKARWS